MRFTAETVCDTVTPSAGVGRVPVTLERLWRDRSRIGCHTYLSLFSAAHLTTQNLSSSPLWSVMINLLSFTLLLSTLGLFIYAPSALAGGVSYDGACNVNDQRLQAGSYQFMTDCDYMTFCNSSGFCDWKSCRRDEYPFGYSSSVPLPPKCPLGSFCPDEEDACQPLLPVGSPCQFNRDGETTV